MPIGVLLASLVTAIAIFPLSDERYRWRTTLNLFGALTQLLLIGIMLWGVSQQRQYETHLPLVQGLDLVLRADALGILFATLSSVLWLITISYAIGYIEESPHRSRFFGFFNLSIMATMGIAMANNLFTLLFFYEILTLTTYPLIVHRGTAKALRAGKIYLRYTLAGSTLLLLGIVWLYQLTKLQDFTEGGILSSLSTANYPSLIFIFMLLTLGFGVKAALAPLHSWLPRAAIAPTPVSAFLHAVAFVKVGTFGMMRVVYDVYGVYFAYHLGVLTLLTLIAVITIIYSSVRALFQDDLKRLLAFSTVNQAAYITLGISLFGTLGITVSIVHFIHQGLVNLTLFLCAGNFAHTLGIHKICGMHGVGKRMPWTMAAFTLGALSMIGLPPFAGFISTWYLGMAALESGMSWIIIILTLSSLLNAAYFLPILHVAWFQEAKGDWSKARDVGQYETSLNLLIPPLVTVVLVIAAGFLAYTPLSPLAWAKVIATHEYVNK
ncbi:MAG: NADH dehydrogenase [Beggiatoa sp. IS2]|nr:MAG: NADH dehydrogenase [Beggiatoa sp. IS2]